MSHVKGLDKKHKAQTVSPPPAVGDSVAGSFVGGGRRGVRVGDAVGAVVVGELVGALVGEADVGNAVVGLCVVGEAVVGDAVVGLCVGLDVGDSVVGEAVGDWEGLTVGSGGSSSVNTLTLPSLANSNQNFSVPVPYCTPFGRVLESKKNG